MPTFTAAQQTIYERCIAAIEAGDDDEVARLSNTIRRFNAHPAEQIDNAVRCVSAAEGRQMVLSSSGEIVTVEEQEEQRRNNEEQRQMLLARQLEQAEREARMARLQETNDFIIAQDIYRACVELYQSSFTEAMTNGLCVESFRSNGHPNLLEMVGE